MEMLEEMKKVKKETHIKMLQEAILWARRKRKIVESFINADPQTLKHYNNCNEYIRLCKQLLKQFKQLSVEEVINKNSETIKRVQKLSKEISKSYRLLIKTDLALGFLFLEK